MSVVVVTGAAGRLGRRLLPLVAADPEVSRIVAIDPAPLSRRVARLDAYQTDLNGAPLGPLLEGVDTLVHLAFSSKTEIDEPGARHANIDGTERLLEAASAAGVGHVVVVSSATVYGAWPNNPVPLTEEASLRPNGGFVYAVQKAQIERLVADWRDDSSERSTAVLRPAMALAEDDSSFIARSLAAAAGIRAADLDPPVQFVHLDDIASAVDLAAPQQARRRLQRRPRRLDLRRTGSALAGAAPRLRLPARLADRLAEWSWELRLGPIPPGLLPYTEHPWVVANDKLRAEGWVPRHSNEEAYVAGTEGSRWSMLTPKRKQELALGASGAALLSRVRAWRSLLGEPDGGVSRFGSSRASPSPARSRHRAPHRGRTCRPGGGGVCRGPPL